MKDKKQKILLGMLVTLCLVESIFLIKNFLDGKKAVEPIETVSDLTPEEAPPVSDGPYVFWLGDRAMVHYVHQDQKISRWFEAQDSMQIAASLENSSENYILSSRPPSPEPDTFSDAPIIITIGDIHGNFDRLIARLKQFEVIDSSGRWNWRDGHLVLPGDILDRGDEVNEALWFIHQLEKDARLGGGRVHFLLGNHEIMVMKGDQRYINKKYTHSVSPRLKISLTELYGPDSEIGRWLRTKHVVVKINNILFVHAGISPDLLSRGYSIQKLNEKIRSSLDTRDYIIQSDDELQFLYSYLGPFWYRGYIKEWKEIPRAEEEQVRAVLDFYGAETIVVGHTILENIAVFYGGLVYAIDTGIYLGSEGEALLWEDGRFFRLTASGEKELLN